MGQSYRSGLNRFAAKVKAPTQCLFVSPSDLNMHFGPENRALICAALFLLAASASASDSKPGDAHPCPRKFTDEQVDRILIEKLPIKYEHRLSVNYTNCRYYMVIWPLPIVVDSNTFVDLDE